MPFFHLLTIPHTSTALPLAYLSQRNGYQARTPKFPPLPLNYLLTFLLSACLWLAASPLAPTPLHLLGPQLQSCLQVSPGLALLSVLLYLALSELLPSLPKSISRSSCLKASLKLSSLSCSSKDSSLPHFSVTLPLQALRHLSLSLYF